MATKASERTWEIGRINGTARRIVLRKGKGNQPHRFRIICTANGEISCSSEGYARRLDRDAEAYTIWQNSVDSVTGTEWDVVEEGK